MEKLQLNELVKGWMINQLIDEINQNRISGASGIEIRQSAGGTVLANTAPGQARLAKITTQASALGAAYQAQFVDSNMTAIGEAFDCYNIRETDSATYSGIGISLADIADTDPVVITRLKVPTGMIVYISQFAGKNYFDFANAITVTCA